ncbi:MAG: pentapeptide repeat-containing protein [Chloroflexi bacterium]|nr:pentapeptide repeat-containing protein [Chloroflexota bacterium]
MVLAMIRRLLRKPWSLALVGGLVVLLGGTFFVAGPGSSGLFGTVINGCEIKPSAQCPNVNLNGAVLKGANLIGADLSGATVIGADLREARLMQANLSRANLSGANLTNAYLEKANLSGANLSNANLGGADLRTAAVLDTDLSGASLVGANAAGANLNLARLCGTTMPNGSVNDEGCSSAAPLAAAPQTPALPTQSFAVQINETFTFTLISSRYDSWRVAQDFDPPIADWQGTQRSPGSGGVIEKWTYKATARGTARARFDLPKFDMGTVESSTIVEVTVK